MLLFLMGKFIVIFDVYSSENSSSQVIVPFVAVSIAV